MTKVVTFGAFVEILPGVEGLVHISELAQHHVENPREIVSQGDPVNVKIIEVDADAGTLRVQVSDEELAQRRAAGASAPTTSQRGYVSLYRRHVTQAPAGCDFDFLALEAGAQPHLDEPVVGRS